MVVNQSQFFLKMLSSDAISAPRPVNWTGSLFYSAWQITGEELSAVLSFMNILQKCYQANLDLKFRINYLNTTPVFNDKQPRTWLNTTAHSSNHTRYHLVMRIIYFGDFFYWINNIITCMLLLILSIKVICAVVKRMR